MKSKSSTPRSHRRALGRWLMVGTAVAGVLVLAAGGSLLVWLYKSPRDFSVSGLTTAVSFRVDDPKLGSLFTTGSPRVNLTLNSQSLVTEAYDAADVPGPEAGVSPPSERLDHKRCGDRPGCVEAGCSLQNVRLTSLRSIQGAAVSLALFDGALLVKLELPGGQSSDRFASIQLDRSSGVPECRNLPARPRNRTVADWSIRPFSGRSLELVVRFLGAPQGEQRISLADGSTVSFKRDGRSAFIDAGSKLTLDASRQVPAAGLSNITWIRRE